MLYMYTCNMYIYIYIYTYIHIYTYIYIYVGQGEGPGRRLAEGREDVPGRRGIMWICNCLVNIKSNSIEY